MPIRAHSKDAKKLLVKQVASSHYFAKSARLREMFVFLCDEVLEHSVREIHEQEVGRRVFSRAADYDTAADNTVRVHASMLRKRINQYFSAEGRGEPFIIEIPRGNYAPVFRERPAVLEPVAEEISEAIPEVPDLPDAPALQIPGARFSWAFWVPTMLAVFFAVVAGSLFLGRKTVSPSMPRTVRMFWSQLLSPGRPADLVLGDAALELVQDMTDRTPVPLAEYYDRSYLARIGDRAAAAKVDRTFANALVLKRQSSLADVSQIMKVTETARTLQSEIRIRFARDYSFRELKANNAILLGYRTSNPWIEPFENQLTLRWKFDPAQNGYLPVDMTGQLQNLGIQGQGQPREAFAMFALVPNLSNTGSVLMVAGTGGAATGAALDFLGNEQSMAMIHTQLTTDANAPFPPFEALLKVANRSTLARDSAIVVVRKLKR